MILVMYMKSVYWSIAVAGTIHSCGPFFANTISSEKTFRNLQVIMESRESFKSFGCLLYALLYSCKSAAPKGPLSMLLIASNLIREAPLKDNQRVSILSAAALNLGSIICVEITKLLRGIKMLQQYRARLIDSRKALESLHRSGNLSHQLLPGCVDIQSVP